MGPYEGEGDAAARVIREAVERELGDLPPGRITVTEGGGEVRESDHFEVEEQLDGYRIRFRAPSVAGLLVLREKYRQQLAAEKKYRDEAAKDAAGRDEPFTVADATRNEGVPMRPEAAKTWRGEGP